MEQAAQVLRVAVVGAGLAGLTAAHSLQQRGHRVVLFEKARGPGGRMATRRHEPWRFDHGAQYFTVRDPRFLERVTAWRRQGLVQPWQGRIAVIENDRVTAASAGTERLVAVPGMSAICSSLAAKLADCRFAWRLESARFNGTWRLRSADGRVSVADALVLAVPPEQAGPLLVDVTLRPAIGEALDAVSMEPCWALLTVLDRPLLDHWDAAFVNQGPLGWICSQPARPGRPNAQAWVLHATPAWSRAHLAADTEEVTRLMLEASRALPGANAVEVRFALPHRWRYALAQKPLQVGALWFAKHRLAIAGDWCAGSRVEGAFLSGVAAADCMLGLDAAPASGDQA